VKTCSKCGETKPIDEFCKGRNVCKICRSQYDKEYYLKNKDKIRERDKEYQKENRLENKDNIREYQKEYWLKNREKLREPQKEYRLKNKDKINEYFKERYRTVPKFRLRLNIGNAMCKSLHGNKKGRHWEDLVGYTLDELRAHIEKQFMDGMNWENYGEWHIDHIIPISRWNFTKPEHVAFKKCWALDNLQPLWAEENLSKNARLECDFQGHLAI